MNQPLSRQQRRHLERKARKPQLLAKPGHTSLPSERLGAARDFDLTELAYRIAVETYGEHLLSEDHKAALMYVAGRLTHLANGHLANWNGWESTRIAYGLSTGGGKTLSAKAWITACHRLKKPYSVILAASEVEALCEIKRELVQEFGVPEEKIALVHRMGKRASEPATPEDQVADRQFVLVSHNMVRTGEQNLGLYNVYNGRPRDLVIYDESLLVSDSLAVKNVVVQEGLDYVARQIDYLGKYHLEPIRAYLMDTLERFLAEADAQIDAIKSGKTRKPIPVIVPELTEYPRHEDDQGVGPLQPDEAVTMLDRDAPAVVKTLLRITGREVRVVAQAARGAVWFTVKVPDELTSVMVLDASHLIRQLPKLGGNIKEDDKAPDAGITFPDLQIEWFVNPAGYGSIRDECQKPRKQRKLARKIADWITGLPDDEPVLIWTFKQRSPRDPVPAERLMEVLVEDHGIDSDRLTVVTHGSHKGSNAFKHIPNVAFYGVFEKDQLVTESEIVGEKRDLLASTHELVEIHEAEMLHDLFQEIARSSVRKIVHGRGGRGRVFLPIWRVPVVDRLNETGAFPGATLVHRPDLEEEQYTAAPPRHRQVAEAIAAVLEEATEDRLSFKAVKPRVQKRLDFELTKDTWQPALALLGRDSAGGYGERSSSRGTRTKSLAGIGWRRAARSFVRRS